MNMFFMYASEVLTRLQIHVGMHACEDNIQSKKQTKPTAIRIFIF